MTLKPETKAHISLAIEFRDQARRLLEIDDAFARIATTAAFDSATNFIQALLLERHSIRITSQPQRQREIEASATLSPISGHFRRIYDISGRARSQPAYVITARRAESLIAIDLAAIERCVLGILDPDRSTDEC